MFWLIITRVVLHLWPFRRGRVWLRQMLARNISSWPEYRTFRFRYGVFVNVSLQEWPIGYRELFLRGVMDDNEVAAWKSVLRKGDMVVDGGANCGYWSLVASHLVGPKGRVVSFEPMRKTFEALTHNVEASRVGNVVIHNYALYSAGTTLTIQTAENDPTGIRSSLMKGNGETWVGSERVTTISLDECIKGGSQIPRLVKLDIEGSELEALKGMERLLAGNLAPLLTIEWNELTAQSFGYHPKLIFEYLASFGYNPFLFDGKRFFPFVQRNDIVAWTPMVWYFKQHMGDRFGE